MLDLLTSSDPAEVEAARVFFRNETERRQRWIGRDIIRSTGRSIVQHLTEARNWDKAAANIDIIASWDRDTWHSQIKSMIDRKRKNKYQDRIYHVAFEAGTFYKH